MEADQLRRRKEVVSVSGNEAGAGDGKDIDGQPASERGPFRVNVKPKLLLQFGGKAGACRFV